ncbi:MAG TPA: LptA/OstA family protein [Alphaproteobacteria bacterium]|nr:LptA/OstA family protein [Alphaproteobacteria bacterium]
MTLRRGMRALVLLAAIQASPLLAADGPTVPGADANQAHDSGPLDITADRDLEWLQQDKAYVARGNAVAKRGTVTLTGDLLIAFYRPKAAPDAPAPQPAAAEAPAKKPGQEGFDTGNTDIWRVVAEGRVHISSQGKEAWGDRMDYDKDQDVVVLTGKALKGKTENETVTARDSLEYWQSRNMGVARGDAVVTKANGQSLAADVIGAHFEKDSTGHQSLKTIQAIGHVVITTASDIVHGDEGTYDLDTKRTVVFGHVRVTRGQSELEGESADVNMDTGISQVFPGKGKRVRALFVHEKAAAAPPATSGARP